MVSLEGAGWGRRRLEVTDELYIQCLTRYFQCYENYVKT